MRILRLLLFVVTLFSSLGVSAQSLGPREKLETEVEEINKVLPISVQQGVVFKKKYIYENSLYEVHEIDENYVSLSLLSKKKNTMKKTLLEKYGTDPNLISTTQLVVECNMDIVIHYVSKQSGKSFNITFSKKELSKCLDY